MRHFLNIMRIKHSQAIVAKALIYSNNKHKILLLKSKWGYWDLPGGQIKFEETPEECLKREIKEEIGVEILIVSLSAIQTVILDRSRRKENPEMKHCSALIFQCCLAQDDAKFIFKDKEIVNCAWWDKAEVINNPNIILLPFNRDLINEFNNIKKIRTKKKYYIKEGEFEI